VTKEAEILSTINSETSAYKQHSKLVSCLQYLCHVSKEANQTQILCQIVLELMMDN